MEEKLTNLSFLSFCLLLADFKIVTISFEYQYLYVGGFHEFG